MNQTEVTRLIPKLRYKLKDRRNLKNPQGPVGRHDKIRKVVTALFKHERIELNFQKADECRGYAERLISDAIRFGDCHRPTMEMASYWIIEKQLVHKLFKVLAPRYQNSRLSYTKMWRAPNIYPSTVQGRCVLELRNNIYPPLGPDTTHNRNLIHNVLLKAAKQAYQKEKDAVASAKNSSIVGEAESQQTKSMQSDASERLPTDSSSDAKTICDDTTSNIDATADSTKLSEVEAANEVTNLVSKLEQNLKISGKETAESKTDNEKEK